MSAIKNVVTILAVLALAAGCASQPDGHSANVDDVYEAKPKRLYALAELSAFKKPVRIVDAGHFCDGGSFSIALEDANGRLFKAHWYCGLDDSENWGLYFWDIRELVVHSESPKGCAGDERRFAEAIRPILLEHFEYDPQTGAVGPETAFSADICFSAIEKWFRFVETHRKAHRDRDAP